MWTLLTIAKYISPHNQKMQVMGVYNIWNTFYNGYGSLILHEMPLMLYYKHHLMVVWTISYCSANFY